MRYMIAVLFVVMMAGCATQSEKLARHGIVTPYDNGIYVAEGKSKKTDLAYKIALASAEQCCLKQGKGFIVVDRSNVAENGLVSEKAADAISIATTAARAAGVFAPVGGDALRGTKSSEITFKCQ